jgi:ribosomal protein L11 methyltransferase
MSWLQLKLAANEANADHLSDLLMLLGAVSVTFADAKDQPIYEPPPGATPLWSQIWVVALFEKETDIQAVLTFLNDSLGDLQAYNYQITDLDDEDWTRSWMTHFHPMSFGKRLWVCPSHEDIDIPDAVKVLLDPGLAFGTGTHPTTALCLRWLDENILGGETVVDYGCGSGILAIAALKLGAARAYAVDNDPQALQATQENSLRNTIATNKLFLSSPEEFKTVVCDILVANILANPLVELAHKFSKLIRPQGKIALSGILDSQVSSVIAAYKDDFQLAEPIILEEWVLLSGVRK